MDAIISQKKSLLEPVNHSTAVCSINSKKLRFLIPIIIGLGLLFASSIGGVGLFAHSTPQWLISIVNTIGQPGNWTFWTMMIGGGVLGLAAITGGIYGMAKKDTCASVDGEEVKIHDTSSSHKEKNNVTEKSIELGPDEAMAFAKGKLSEHPEIKPIIFLRENAHQPVNPDIALLAALNVEIYYPAFQQTMKQYKDNPWAHDEVIRMADAYMKITYAIGCLTLEDLPEFTKRLKAQNGQDFTYAQALARKDSYLYQIYWCPECYHLLRGEIVWQEGLYYKEEISEEHAKTYYQEGTIQYNWRMLYNDYCNKVRNWINESELEIVDQRHISWTKKDEGVDTFTRIPGSRPT